MKKGNLFNWILWLVITILLVLAPGFGLIPLSIGFFIIVALQLLLGLFVPYYVLKGSLFNKIEIFRVKSGDKLSLKNPYGYLKVFSLALIVSGLLKFFLVSDFKLCLISAYSVSLFALGIGVLLSLIFSRKRIVDKNVS